MATALIYTPEMAFQSGVFAPGAKAYFYLTGTTTPVTVYQDAAYATAHASPVVADAAGMMPRVFYNGASQIKAVITAADDTAITTIDPVNKVSSSDSGADSISFSAITGNPSTTVQDAIELNTNARENRSADVKAMLASADNAAIIAGFGDFTIAPTRIVGATTLGINVLTGSTADYTRAQLYAAPRPATGTGVGEFRAIAAGDGVALVVPAGGQWAYSYFIFSTSGTVITTAASVVAGGSTISGTSDIKYGFAWRVLA